MDYLKNDMVTPCFIISKEKLNDAIDELYKALEKYWNHYIVGYSYKTNSLWWVVNHMKSKGFYAEVVSEDEYYLAQKAGYTEQIIYNGPIKTKDTFLCALKNHNIINIDSKYELKWIREYALAHKSEQIKIGIRVNFDLESMCPGEAFQNERGGRFGFSYETGEFKTVLDELNQIDNVYVNGIHLHCSSRTRSLNVYKAIAQMACVLQKEYQLDLEYVDIGGGFFGGMENKPKFEDYFREISAVLGQCYDVEKTKLIVEPGTSLICAPVDYVTTVLDVKTTLKGNFVVTDGSRTHIDPLMSKTGYFHEVYCNNHLQPIKEQVICGYTCMENDRLFVLEDSSKLEEGDKIVYKKVGAYTICLMPLFIKYFPDVYVQDGEALYKVREKWNVDNYIQNSI